VIRILERLGKAHSVVAGCPGGGDHTPSAVKPRRAVKPIGRKVVRRAQPITVGAALREWSRTWTGRAHSRAAP
jgi:hypothetical protein